MLDRLPTELLLRIFELAASLDYSPSFYLERRHLLLDCSLVSKKLCAAAQPMLPEIYEAETDKDVSVLEVEVGGKKRGSMVKVLVVRGKPNKTGTNCIDVDHLLALASTIVDVRFLKMGIIDLEWLNGCFSLKRLIMCGGTLRFRSDAILPSLVELSLCGNEIDDGFFQTFPTPQRTPSLRAFGIASPTRGRTNDVRSLGDLSPTFLRQLDILSLDMQDRYLDTYTDGSPPPSLLLDSDMDQPERLLNASMLPTNVRLCLCMSSDDFDSSRVPIESACGTLQALTGHVARTTPSAPFSVILPPFLGAEVEGSDELKLLHDALVADSGEIIREKEADWVYESLISPEIWRRMRRRKLEEAAGRN